MFGTFGHSFLCPLIMPESYSLQRFYLSKKYERQPFICHFLAWAVYPCGNETQMIRIIS